jgi:glucans biosynthesis protein
MSEIIDRRTVLKGAAATAAGLAMTDIAAASWTDGLRLGEPIPFSYESFKAEARALSKAPYSGPPRPE